MTILRIALLEGADRKVLTNDRSSEWGTRDGKYFSAENLRVSTWHRESGNVHFGFNMLHMAKLVRASNVVLLGGWESPVYVQLLVISKFMRKPVVLFHESTLKSARHKRGPVLWLKKTMFGSMDAIVVPGVASHELVRSLGVPGDKIYEGFNAVDMEFFRRDQNYLEDINSHAVKQGHKFLYLGRLRKDKRIDYVVRAFSRIRGSADQLSIVGSGPEYAPLRELVASMGLDDVVDFLGPASYEDIPSVLQAHDTLVLASRHDVWGLVVNEALASGLHVVVSDRCGVWQSVCHMRGVYVWHEGADSSLDDLMDRSAKDWSGPVPEPQILAMDNERFAKVFVESICTALNRKSRGQVKHPVLRLTSRLRGKRKFVERM